MKEASYYEKTSALEVICHLCPHECRISEGHRGNCRVRRNKNGTLIAENYGRVSAMHLDPIEKKPLYHFFPGSHILSAGSIGCNLSCKFCQNCEISQVSIDDRPLLPFKTPEEIVAAALNQPGNIGIAFTYNEPVVWFEYMEDIAVQAKAAGLATVMVTNGFVNPAPLERLIDLIDAFSVDLKAFTDEFYHRITFSSLEPVKNSLKQISKAGKHLEVTNLVIPDLNDDPLVFEEMVQWMALELGKDTVLHISRYFPMHRMTKPPTPLATLQRLSEIASRHLNYVYIGNVPYFDNGS